MVPLDVMIVMVLFNWELEHYYPAFDLAVKRSNLETRRPPTFQLHLEVVRSTHPITEGDVPIALSEHYYQQIRPDAYVIFISNSKFINLNLEKESVSYRSYTH